MTTQQQLQQGEKMEAQQGFKTLWVSISSKEAEAFGAIAKAYDADIQTILSAVVRRIIGGKLKIKGSAPKAEPAPQPAPEARLPVVQIVRKDMSQSKPTQNKNAAMRKRLEALFEQRLKQQPMVWSSLMNRPGFENNKKNWAFAKKTLEAMIKKGLVHQRLVDGLGKNRGGTKTVYFWGVPEKAAPSVDEQRRELLYGLIIKRLRSGGTFNKTQLFAPARSGSGWAIGLKIIQELEAAGIVRSHKVKGSSSFKYGMTEQAQKAWESLMTK
jgi:predicted transcriptional regulator